MTRSLTYSTPLSHMNQQNPAGQCCHARPRRRPGGACSSILEEFVILASWSCSTPFHSPTVSTVRGAGRLCHRETMRWSLYAKLHTCREKGACREQSCSVTLWAGDEPVSTLLHVVTTACSYTDLLKCTVVAFDDSQGHSCSLWPRLVSRHAEAQH